MDEKIFQNEIRSSINYLYPLADYTKIPDPVGKIAEQTIKRPYDAFYIYQNKFVAIEYKQMKQPLGFPFDKVQEHQIYNLTKIKSTFNHAYILINYRFQFSDVQMKKYKTDQSKHNFAICFDIIDYIIQRICYRDFLNRKSIPFEEFWEVYQKKTKALIEWTKHKDTWIWDLRKILEEK